MRKTKCLRRRLELSIFFFLNFNWDLIANICHHCWKEFLKISVKLPLRVICWKIKFCKVVEFLQWGARLCPNYTNIFKILGLHGAVCLFVLDLITLSLDLVSFLILRHSFEQCWLIFTNWSFLTLQKTTMEAGSIWPPPWQIFKSWISMSKCAELDS